MTLSKIPLEIMWTHGIGATADDDGVEGWAVVQPTTYMGVPSWEIVSGPYQFIDTAEAVKTLMNAIEYVSLNGADQDALDLLNGSLEEIFAYV